MTFRWQQCNLHCILTSCSNTGSHQSNRNLGWVSLVQSNTLYRWCYFIVTMALRIFALYQRRTLVLLTVSIFGLYSTTILAVRQYCSFVHDLQRLNISILSNPKFIVFKMKGAIPVVDYPTLSDSSAGDGIILFNKKCDTYISNLWVYCGKRCLGLTNIYIRSMILHIYVFSML